MCIFKITNFAFLKYYSKLTIVHEHFTHLFLFCFTTTFWIMKLQSEIKANVTLKHFFHLSQIPLLF